MFFFLSYSAYLKTKTKKKGGKFVIKKSPDKAFYNEYKSEFPIIGFSAKKNDE